MAMALGDAQPALRLYRTAGALRAELGTPVAPADRDRHEVILARAQEQLDTDMFRESLVAGQRASADEAVEGSSPCCER